MKSVIGRLVSSKPIPISKSASIISKFVSAENGASQAISAYLRRASEAFNELAQLHKELKSSTSASKPHRKNRSNFESDVTVGEKNPTSSSHPGAKKGDHTQERSHVIEQSAKKRRKKESEGKGGFKNSVDDKFKLGARVEGETRLLDEFDVNMPKESGKKKHKKKRTYSGEDFENRGPQNGDVEARGGFHINEIEENRRKKRKSIEVEVGGEIGSEKQRSKEKKRRRTGDGDS